jgi:hypothetical protein
MDSSPDFPGQQPTIGEFSLDPNNPNDVNKFYSTRQLKDLTLNTNYTPDKRSIRYIAKRAHLANTWCNKICPTLWQRLGTEMAQYREAVLKKKNNQITVRASDEVRDRIAEAVQQDPSIVEMYGKYVSRRQARDLKQQLRNRATRW